MLRMFLVLIYYISLSILQITGVSVSWNSPSRIYSSVNSKSVPIYNGYLQQQSSTIQPYRISGGTLTSLNENQIDNLEISSNRGLGLNTNKIFVSQDGQIGDNNGDSVSDYAIINIRPSEISGGSSQTSTKIQNFDIPVQDKVSELSSNYHGINKNSELGRINDISKLYESSGIDRGFQLGKLGTLSGSIIEDGTNIADGEYRRANEIIGKINTADEMGDTGIAVNFNGLNLLNSSDELNEEKNEKNRNHKVEIGRGVNENREEGRDKELSGSFGSIRFSSQNENRAGGSGGEEEGGGIGFSGSKGSIQFNGENDGRFGGSGGVEWGNKGLSGSKESIKFNGENDGRFGGSGGVEWGNKGSSGSKGSIKFDGKNDGRFGGSGGVEWGNKGSSGSKGSIKFDRKNDGRFGESGEVEWGNKGFGGSKGSIKFDGKNDGRFGGSGGVEWGNKGHSGSKGSIRFDGKYDGRFGGSSEVEGGNKWFSGSNGSISFNRKNEGKTDGSGRGNMRIGGGRIARRLSRLRNIGKVNRSGEKRNFGGSVGGIQYSKENGNKELSKSNTVNIKINDGNYRSGRFGGNIKSNTFGEDSGGMS